MSGVFARLLFTTRNLGSVIDAFSVFSSYEPELHPGVTFKVADPKATLKIFSTGSLTITGRSKFSFGSLSLVGPTYILVVSVLQVGPSSLMVVSPSPIDPFYLLVVSLITGRPTSSTGCLYHCWVHFL